MKGVVYPLHHTGSLFNLNFMLKKDLSSEPMLLFALNEKSSSKSVHRQTFIDDSASFDVQWETRLNQNC